jgi:hypothetical protein
VIREEKISARVACRAFGEGEAAGEIFQLRVRRDNAFSPRQIWREGRRESAKIVPCFPSVRGASCVSF